MKPKPQKIKIKKIDDAILRLLAERIHISRLLGASGGKISSSDIAEDNAHLLHLLKRKEIPEAALKNIYREIFSVSRAAQESLTVACLGPEGSYSHQAAMERFGSQARYLFCRSIPEVFAAISREEADTGMAPVENSIEGGVNAALDCLVHTDLVIQGEIHLRIHNLLCASPKHGTIKRIYSHPQPLGQCRQWLLAHYPNIEQIEVASTSEGARRVQKDEHAAAIVSPLSAQIYKLKILGKNISDAMDNTTRFLILGEYPAKRSVQCKTSLIFAVAHEVGALSAILNIFASHGLNLQKIESRPAPHKAWEYLFFVDVAGHFQDSAFAKALTQIRRKTLWLKILGSYPTY
ncbi:MAG: prephenate dehydratase [Verrucomicrobiota bacterium]